MEIKYHTLCSLVSFSCWKIFKFLSRIITHNKKGSTINIRHEIYALE